MFFFFVDEGYSQYLQYFTIHILLVFHMINFQVNNLLKLMTFRYSKKNDLNIFYGSIYKRTSKSCNNSEYVFL